MRSARRPPGFYALSESYLYTVEALQAYLDRLAPGGMLAITRWVEPAAARYSQAVRHGGRGAGTTRRRSNLAQQLALIRGWKTATLLVKNGAFTARRSRRCKTFCRARSFDVDVLPGHRSRRKPIATTSSTSPDSTTASSRCSVPHAQEFLDRYKFNIAPATDDRPYFFHFFKWRTLPELLALKEQRRTAAARMGLSRAGRDTGPGRARQRRSDPAAALDHRRRRQRSARPAAWTRPRSRGAISRRIGFAFMFIEIAFIQKFILFLGSSAVCRRRRSLCFPDLCGSGQQLFATLVGSRFVGSWIGPIGCDRHRHRADASSYLLVLPVVFRSLMPLSDAARS